MLQVFVRTKKKGKTNTLVTQIIFPQHLDCDGKDKA